MTILAKPGDTVTFDWSFRRPTGDAPTITGTPAYHVIQGASTVKASASMTSVTGTRYTATWATSSGTAGEYTVYGTGTFDGLSGEEQIAKIDISQEMTNIAALTTAKAAFIDVSIASRAATTAANLQALTTARVERLDATITSRSTNITNSSGIFTALTTGRISNLDNLDATVSSRSTTITGSTNIQFLSSGRIDNLDFLDIAVSSRSTSTNFSASLVWAANATASNTSGTAGRYLSDLKKRHLNTVTATTAVLTVYQDNSTSSAAWTQSLSSAGSIITQGVQTT